MREMNGFEFYNNLFDSEEKATKRKAQAFDELASMFYNKNFGTATKSEIELKMFSILMDALIDANKNSDGVLDYSACSDYQIGKQLGIPQEKVRTLKIKKQARYPQQFKWTDSLISLKDNIRYDESKDKIMIPMPDPNLYNEIRNFIEEKGGFIEIQRSNNVIQIRPEYFFILLYQATESEEEKEKIKFELVKKIKECNENMCMGDIKTDKELSAAALSYGDDFFDLAVSVAESLPVPIAGIIKCFQGIFKVIKRKKINR